MANFLMGDVLFGQNALTNTTGFMNQIDSITISNGVFTHVNVENVFDDNPSSTEPTEWGDTFIMDAPFTDGVSGGSTGNLLGVANQILVKRRPSNVYTNIGDGWITIARIPIATSEDLKFVIYDYTCANNTQYEYVLIPTLIQNQGGLEVQVETSITNNSTVIPVMSEFNKVYICNLTGAKGIEANTSYDSMSIERLTGTHQTLGSKYPIVVSNSIINYESGGVHGKILNDNYGSINPETGKMVQLNRNDIVKARESYREFITKGKPYILKDWNGNSWLVMVTDSPSYTFDDAWGMGIGEIDFHWTQIGEIEDQEDLDKAGMVYVGGGQE